MFGDQEGDDPFVGDNTHVWMYCDLKVANSLMLDFIDRGGGLEGDTRVYFDTKLDNSMSLDGTLLETSDSDTDHGSEWLQTGPSRRKRLPAQTRRLFGFDAGKRGANSLASPGKTLKSSMPAFNFSARLTLPPLPAAFGISATLAGLTKGFDDRTSMLEEVEEGNEDAAHTRSLDARLVAAAKEYGERSCGK